LLLGLLLVFGLAQSAKADTINFSWTGTGSGSIGQDTFTDVPFRVSIDANTANFGFQGFLDSYGYVDLAGTIDIAGEGTASFLSPLFVFGANGCDCLGFGTNANANLIAFFNQGLGIPGYDLRSNFGPITGVNNNLDQFYGVGTSLGTLSYQTMSPVTFVATTATTPEPGTLVLFGTGLAGFIGTLRRRLAFYPPRAQATR